VPLGSLVYRKNARMKAEHKKRSHRMAQQAYELSEFFARKLKAIPVTLPRAPHEDAASAAHLVRNALGVDQDSPIKNLLHRVERMGVRVFTSSYDVPDLDAFSTWIEGRQPVVVLNPMRPGDRQAFSLAHELGHLVMHYPLTAGQEHIEDEANLFAAELLMPADAIRPELSPPITLSLLAELKSRWRVSIGALLQRAKELQVVTDRQYKYLRMQMAQSGWTKREPVEIAPERPRGFLRMAEAAYGGSANTHRIAHDTKRPPFLVARLLDTSTETRGENGDGGRLLGFPTDSEEEALA
jgi:Zn-dependent peptidase ImmA (M78 family)